MSGCALRQGLVALVVAALAACGGGKSGQVSQVVAKVNDSEITVSQLSEALASRGAGGPASPEVTRQAVDSLINEQLLVQGAMDSKLDRDPAVVQMLERTRRQVLARAYLERRVFPRDAVSNAEQSEYYKQHPALFEKRKTYSVMVYTVKATELAPVVRAGLEKAHTPDEVGKMLTAHAIPHEVQAMTRGAEQLPLEDLPRFEAAAVGDLVTLKAHQGRLPMMLITGIQESPISEERAQPIIQQYLANTRNERAVAEHLKTARAVAKISYFDNVSSVATEQIAGQLQNAVASERDGTQTGGASKPAISLN